MVKSHKTRKGDDNNEQTRENHALRFIRIEYLCYVPPIKRTIAEISFSPFLNTDDLLEIIRILVEKRLTMEDILNVKTQKSTDGT
jgi:hypothetical protein